MITYKATYTKTVRLVKSDTEIVVHLSRGSFARHKNGRAVEVDGEWGRSGERCGNDYHNDYATCKRDFFAYIGEKVLDGYVVDDVKTENSNA